ncbi:hypothetical protein AAX26_01828 [Aliarcobacter thereius]|uniref:hypothetical protein n=1 Tax=Aliarcobacter thereius TaxID=544718 RepID=UPI000825FE39|nr:hypothetical protein [Aliarcobacter thereius]OCL85761.1 hypothetical protein AAX26_01828 [Aliarcobacter thereius]OCL89809.1 hypothetical protein AAX25_01934 [Aliarcobacter thereius]TLT06196.1 hypothetical protein FE243_08610 [Aliarcobacter thereius]
MKSSFVLFELIIATILSAIIFTLVSFLYKDTVLQNRLNQELSLENLSLNSLRVFLEKNINNFDELSFRNKNLYFQNEPLYLGLLYFNIEKSSNFYKVSLQKENSKEIIWFIKK